MKKLHGLKVRRYAARLIDLNMYFSSFPGDTSSEKIGVTELNKILLNSIPNSCSKHACGSILLKKYVNISERMDIDESIYKGMVKPSYKNLLGQTSTVMVK